MSCLVNWIDSSSLRQEEVVLESWDVISTIRASHKLALTNQRLVVMEPEFEVKFFGLTRKVKSWKQRYFVSLETIKYVSTKQPMEYFYCDADLEVVPHDAKHVWHVRVPNTMQLGVEYGAGAKYFRDVVLQQVKDRKQELERKKPSVVLDFSFLQTYMKKGGMIITTLKCPECGGKIKLPEKGTQTFCEHCGSTIYAENMFDKIKQLIE